VSELPNGWAMITISDITEYLSRGKQPKYAKYSNLPVINQKAIRWFGIQSEYLKYVDPAQFDRWEAERFIQAGDILWNSTGTGTLGRACLIKPHDLEPPKVVDSHVTIVRPNQAAIDPRFLFSWIQSSEVQENIASLATGATNQIELSRATIASMHIPIAPLKEQKDIANKLDSLLARVDACRDRLDRVSHIIKCFRQAVFDAAVSGQLTKDWANSNEDAGWSTYSLGELLFDIRYGTAKKSSYTVSGSTPVIRIPNIKNGKVDIHDLKYGQFDDREIETLSLAEGDLLVIRSNGSIDLVGRAAVVTSEAHGYLFAGYLIRLRLNTSLIEPQYLRIFLESSHIRQYIELTARSTNGINNINSREVREIELKLPSLNEQQEIVHQVELLFAYADRLEVRHHNALIQVERLTPLLLEKAFHGELVPQDPNDETAAILLERIRAERIAKPKQVVVNRKPKMPKMTEKSVKEVIRQLPSETFSFDELREKISGDYDLFKDILFTLLSEAEPSLMQVFDQEAKAMRFVRGDK